VHVTYVIPADAPNRIDELASKIVADLAAADAWWQREDPTRTIRFDRFAFPGCASKLGSLDLGFLRLARPAAAYEGDQGIVGMVPELTDLAELDFHKNLVYYDGPSLYGPTVCGTTLVPRNDPVRGGLGGLAFIWLRSLCGQDVGTGNLNAEVVTHELIHGLGFVGTGSSLNECPEPNRGHVCDSELDILYPEATLETTLAAKRLDVNHDDYYDNEAGPYNGDQSGDLQDSPYLTHLPQKRLALGVRAPGNARGMIRMTFPAPFNCRDACALALDTGVAVTLIATPSRESRFLGWSGVCKGRGVACYVTLRGDRTVTALFGPATFRLSVTVAGRGRVSSAPSGLACAGRCSAAFEAGSQVSLRATAAAGHRFAGWTGSCRGKSRCIIGLDRDRSVVARFARAP
jgi:hypothetical protein